MSIKINININDAATKAGLDNLEKALLNKKELNDAAGQAVYSSVFDHIREKYLPKDQNGLTFWERTLESMVLKVTNNEAVVSLSETGIGLRYYGGEVYPGKNPARSGPNKGSNTRALSVPTSNVPVKRGKRVPPSLAGPLAFLRAKGKGDTVGYLVKAKKVRGSDEYRAIPKGQTGSALMYVLRKVTRHKPDKNILPADSTLTEEAAKGIEAYLKKYL